MNFRFHLQCRRSELREGIPRGDQSRGSNAHMIRKTKGFLKLNTSQTSSISS